MRTLKILVTGGGSSGHISPALATMSTLRQMAEEDGAWTPQFLYIGGKKGLEKEQVERAQVPFVGIVLPAKRSSLTVCPN